LKLNCLVCSFGGKGIWMTRRWKSKLNGKAERC
jgi:hypothetical protein